ncbi:hypothetical protein FO519_009183 [Halicephalobus sp. NKZ332]|nr:hypothetical protein FO519_009183 [Halicephalobus sp. NKZ332]
MSSQKNGTVPTSDDMLAKALKEIRRKAQVDGTKKPADGLNGEEQVTEFEKEPKQIPDETEDPEVLEIMEKIKPAPGYDKKRNYSEIIIGADSFLLGLDKKTRSYLDTKPSCLDGLTPEEEEDLRFLGAELIENMVYLLKLPMIVGETACIFFQRFYGVQSFVKHPMEHFVMASVLLATKVEEVLRSPREIITVFDHLKKLYTRRTDKSAKVDVLKVDSQYVMMKNNIVVAERRLLLNLGFVCQIKHPHGYIYVYLKTLILENNMRIFNTAWASMNDCMKTDLFLRYYPKTIAAACVVRTCRRSDPEFELPIIDEYHWYEVYGVSSKDVEHIIEILDRLYERKQAPDWMRLISSVAEARKRKFGTETVVKLSEEEAKKAIKDEEAEKDENGLKSYSRKLATSPRKDDKRKSRSRRTKEEEADPGIRTEIAEGIETRRRRENVIMTVTVIARETGNIDRRAEVDPQ